MQVAHKTGELQSASSQMVNCLSQMKFMVSNTAALTKQLSSTQHQLTSAQSESRRLSHQLASSQSECRWVVRCDKGPFVMAERTLHFPQPCNAVLCSPAMLCCRHFHKQAHAMLLDFDDTVPPQTHRNALKTSSVCLHRKSLSPKSATQAMPGL